MADFQALSGIDLDIYERECLLVAGANGSGKTLLMKILAGLIEPTGGEVYFRGNPLKKNISRLRNSVGLVYQDADSQILGETVEEDIRFGPENFKVPLHEIDRRLEENLSALDLAAKRDFPARHLSGGEKRRLAVAGILAMGCDVIIMDEPFANLDWPGVMQVLEIIVDLKKNQKTVIILTHELEKVLALADRLVILARGKIRDNGKPEDVLDRLEPAWGVRDPRRVYRNAGECTWLELNAGKM
ncbi:MAG: energy-coupling factor ABC transporter ATP-binding protein [Treponema sp.]|nr:energy-coupling factor ABC transporter ATP-binding protein [Treponema sp.]